MVVAVIQCRMSSTRLPGKVLLPILGKPMLLHIVERLRGTKTVDRITLGTSASPADDPIFQLAREHGIRCFRGSEQDVLGRFYQAVREEDADNIVRITADCPFTDARVVDRVVRQFLQAQVDYAVHPRPQGLDVEVFTRRALQQAWRETQDKVDREHVTPYLRLSGKFKTLEVEPGVDISHVTNGWSVDTEVDLKFVRAVYEHLYRLDPGFGVREILQLLKDRPELMNLNAGQNRYAGFYRSMASSDEECAPPPRAFTRCNELHHRAKSLIPSRAWTLEQGSSQYTQGSAPPCLLSGKGSHVWDVDGNEYIDYRMAHGAVILGHNYSAVAEAVIEAVRSGALFSGPHPLEVELAELLCELIPCAEMVRFGKNGSDVTTAAIRAARTITGRGKVVCCGFHGWPTARNKGVPSPVAELTLTFPYNDLDVLEELFRNNPGQIAAVIIEPVQVEQPKTGFLEGVRDLAHQAKALLIFNEIATGFRVSIGGAQQYFQIKPDLATFGKAIANGFALSAIVGKRAYMEIFDKINFPSRLAGEITGLAAAAACLKELRAKNVFEHIWRLGQKLKEGYMILAREHGLLEYTECVGLLCSTAITFRDHRRAESLSMKAFFEQECLTRGILVSGKHNLSFSHSDTDIDRTLRVYSTALRKLRLGIDSGNLEAGLGSPVCSA